MSDRVVFTPSPWGDRRRIRVGLLGGSFDPAHEGHFHISEVAKRCLGLNQVWWLVSPQNPLKPSPGATPLVDRMIQARHVAKVPWLKITALEQEFGTDRTWQTLAILRQRFPQMRFVWLMGADNLAQIPFWARWTQIFQMVHVAVFDRSPYSHNVLSGKASRRYALRRIKATHASALWTKPRPMWVYIAQKRHSASSSKIRLRRDDSS